MRFLWTAATIGVAYWAAEMVLDRFIIRSDNGDPTGFVTQSAGFGLDDVVRIMTIGSAGAIALGFVRRS